LHINYKNSKYHEYYRNQRFIFYVPLHTIYYEGNKELKFNRNELLHKIGVLIEKPCYYDNLTGLDHLKYLNYFYNKGTERIEYALSKVGLQNAKNKKVKNYSTGMKQRLGIAMAVFHDPEILILDEPLNGLDPEGIYDVRNLIVDMNAEGKTVLLSSHSLSEVEKICTHIGILENGQLIFQDNIQNVRKQTNNDLESFFLNIIS